VFRFVYKSVFVVNLNLVLLATLLPSKDQDGRFFARVAVAVLHSFLSFDFSLIAPLIVFISWGVVWVTCRKRRFFVSESGVIRCLKVTLSLGLLSSALDPLDGMIGVLGFIVMPTGDAHPL
jgi:Na+/phosphate symporter